MNLLSLPIEVRVRIYDFCFPPLYARVQLIPCRTSDPICHLNLPLSLYLVCKLIHDELPPLASKLRSLDLLYVIQGAFIGPYARPKNGPRTDDDPKLQHFQKILRFAERIRLVGEGPSNAMANGQKRPGRSISCASRRLVAGPDCGLRVLEVQPLQWPKRLVVRTVMSCLGLLTTHPDVAERLEVRLIRDNEHLDGEEEEEDRRGVNADLQRIENWLSRYQNLCGDDVTKRFSASGDSFA